MRNSSSCFCVLQCRDEEPNKLTGFHYPRFSFEGDIFLSIFKLTCKIRLGARFNKQLANVTSKTSKICILTKQLVENDLQVIFWTMAEHFTYSKEWKVVKLFKIQWRECGWLEKKCLNCWYLLQTTVKRQWAKEANWIPLPSVFLEGDIWKC